MTSIGRLALLTALPLACVVAYADNTSVQLQSFPSMSVADGRSTVTVTARVVKRNGDPVPDGTQVYFETTIGRFREAVVTTTGGRARAILVAGGIPGTAVITAKTLGAAPSRPLEVEFLSDRSLLNSAKEYVEVYAPGFMRYNVDLQILEAAGPQRGVKIRYREVEIEADDAQLYIPMYELRARKAKVRIGNAPPMELDELYLKLNSRRGFGLGTMTLPLPTRMAAMGRGIAFVGNERRFGYMELNKGTTRPVYQAPDRSLFTFRDITEYTSSIAAKKAVVFPRKEIQFQQAEILMGDDIKVMKMPLFQYSLVGGQNVVTENFVNIADNQLAINYPHYLSLKPGETSLLRFRTGERYGRGTGATRGLFLDYELNWNRGDEMDGGLTVSNIARKDWSIGLRQYYRINDNTTANAQVETPSGRNLYGNVSMNHQMAGGYSLNFHGSGNRSLKGTPFSSQTYSFSIDKDPMRLPKLPINMYLGVRADYNEAKSDVFDRQNTSYGPTMRLQMDPIRVDRETTFVSNFSVSHLMGDSSQVGLTLAGSASLSRTFRNGASLTTTYDFSEDPFSSDFLGKHRLSVRAGMSNGRLDFNFMGSRALDVDRQFFYADLSYDLNSRWRFGYSYTFDRFLNNTYMDYDATLAYKIGAREIGLVWSHRTKRLGIQLFGTTIN